MAPLAGAVKALVTVPLALLAPTTTDGGSQPEIRHSCLNAQCPAVPGVGPAKHV
jgi:hypothetical protein